MPEVGHVVPVETLNGELLQIDLCEFVGIIDEYVLNDLSRGGQKFVDEMAPPIGGRRYRRRGAVRCLIRAYCVYRCEVSS